MEQLKLDIAGICIQYAIEDDLLSLHIRNEMGEFVSDRKPDLELRIEPLSLETTDTYLPLQITDSGTGMIIQRHDQRCLIDLEQKTGQAVMASNTFAFGTFLRGLYSRLLLDHRGIILHASAVIRNNRGYVCTGPSGTGKTTIAMLSPENFLLTDELVILRQSEDGAVRAYGTPFIGESMTTGFNRSVQVDRLFYLVQAERNAAAPISTPEALKRAMGQVMFFDRSPAANGRLLDILSDLLAALDTMELKFLPDPSVWELIDEFA